MAVDAAVFARLCGLHVFEAIDFEEFSGERFEERWVNFFELPKDLLFERCGVFRLEFFEVGDDAFYVFGVALGDFFRGCAFMMAGDRYTLNPVSAVGKCLEIFLGISAREVDALGMAPNLGLQNASRILRIETIQVLLYDFREERFDGQWVTGPF